jgi:hypothetical protein
MLRYHPLKTQAKLQKDEIVMLDSNEEKFDAVVVHSLKVQMHKNLLKTT